jgi:hypothetical protein
MHFQGDFCVTDESYVLEQVLKVRARYLLEILLANNIKEKTNFSLQII